ncbi:MAG: S24/S26 family peptidase, partial [Pseudomonadota bacterium]
KHPCYRQAMSKLVLKGMDMAALLKQSLDSKGLAWFRATGHSMVPALQHGDHLLVAKRTPRIGEIVVYECTSGVRAHRVIAKNGNMFHVMGDALACELEFVPERFVLGTIVDQHTPLSLKVARLADKVAHRVIRALGLVQLLRD